MTANARIPVSVVIPTKNEEPSIVACIQSVQACDQVIVVDSASQDRTKDLAASVGAEVINYVWDGHYPKKKQWCLDNLSLKHNWVLFVDADEKPTQQLLEEIFALSQLGRLDDNAAYDIALDYHFLGKQLRHGHRVVKRALVDHRRTHFPILADLDAPGMGEQEGHYQPVAEGSIGMLRGRITHDDQDRFSTWIARHNRYSDWEAYLKTHPDLGARIQSLRSGRGRRYRKAPLKPLAFFVYSYIVRRGFLDGKAGLHYALAHAFYFWQISVKQLEHKLDSTSGEILPSFKLKGTNFSSASHK